jgi:hypothetical protein
MLVVGFLLLQKFVRPRSQNPLIRLSTLFAGEVKQKIARDWSITLELTHKTYLLQSLNNQFPLMIGPNIAEIYPTFVDQGRQSAQRHCI